LILTKDFLVFRNKVASVKILDEVELPDILREIRLPSTNRWGRFQPEDPDPAVAGADATLTKFVFSFKRGSVTLFTVFCAQGVAPKVLAVPVIISPPRAQS
jgi:hypothetical protein